jgi:hypothetical protein
MSTANEFGAELNAHVEAHPRGELESLTWEDAQAQMQRLGSHELGFGALA